jgi:hypothetical protein
MPGEDETAIGFTPGIEGFEAWIQGDYGCADFNHLLILVLTMTLRGMDTIICSELHKEEILLLRTYQ